MTANRIGNALLAFLIIACRLTAASNHDPPWQAMDYGPFLTASIEAPHPATNIAYKGVAINLGKNFGGNHNEAVIFDTDLLRYSAGWTGDFVALKGVAFDGEHWAYPQIAGQQIFGNPAAPGWAHNGSFNDPRSVPYGPLPKNHAHWKGLYLHEHNTTLAYTVGEMSILEMPSLEQHNNTTAFARILNLSPSSVANTVQIAFDPQMRAELVSLNGNPVKPSDPATKCLAVLAGHTPPQKSLAAAFVGADNARWVITNNGHVRLQLPASLHPSRGKVLLWSGPREALPAFIALVKASPPPANLEPFTHGGPSRWTERIHTQGTTGTNNGPYAIDVLTEPDPNPWHSWMRFGGLDFFPDGRRAALSTWNGDVWVVSGVDDDSLNLTWQRIATGLFQPLGLRIVDNVIYVLGRDQISRLHDFNGDGEIDFYENFNNDSMVSEHFHEFATDLKTGPDGSFYYIKCGCHGATAKHPHHGTVLKVAKDGSSLEVIARGLRANNGLGVGPNGELTSIDNQGHWMPANRINWIQPGGWYGYQWAWNPDNRTTYDEPLCWMHNAIDRSGGTQLWVPTDALGPFRDKIITISYGMGHIFLLLKEEVNGQPQGAVTRFPLEFETGVMRGAWHPHNGQLYAAGLYGWAGNKTKAGGFYRIRRTGQPVHMANAIHFVHDGVVLSFTEPLDPLSATDPGNYHVTAWNYRWTAEYGSPDFKLNGQEGRDSWPVTSTALSADRKTVFLQLPDVQRVMQIHVDFQLTFADGTKAANFVHGTIHHLSSSSGADWLGKDAFTRADDAKPQITQPSPGLIQTFHNSESSKPHDIRMARLPALFIPAATSPTPFLEPGPFNCRWTGFLKLDLNDLITFTLEGHGSASLTINGEIVLTAHNLSPNASRSEPIPLRSGLNRFELDFQSPMQGNSEIRLSWSSSRIPLEPIPPTAFVHDAADSALSQRLFAREGRGLFATHQCARCHKPSSPWPSDAMPELSADAPSFNGIGSRLNAPWIVQWLLDPKSIRPDASMPRLLTGPTAHTDAADIAAYLATLNMPHTPPAQPHRPAPKVDAQLVATGAQTFHNLGCVACHLLPDEPTLAHDSRVPLHHIAAKWKFTALEEFLRAPSAHYRWTPMPDFNLTADEATALAAFLIDRTHISEQQFLTVANTDTPSANPSHGRDKMLSLGCLACHTLDGIQDPFTAPSLARLQMSDWTQGCLAPATTDTRNTPDYQFSPAQIDALQAFARDGFPDALRRDPSAEFAERAYASLRCNACHSRDSETDQLTQLLAATPRPENFDDDTDDETTGGGSVHLGRPLLTFAGEKLYADWIQRLLEGSLSYKPRPELRERMPAFPPFAAGLAQGLAHQHGYPAQAAPPMAVDPHLVEIGRRLTLVQDGFSCIACHNVGTQRALAGKDTATVDFTCIAERLRPSYYWRYLRDPVRLVPSTMMPKFIGDDGTTPIKSVFNGDPEQQFEAVWHYLNSLR